MDPEPPVKRPRGRPPKSKTQPEIDTSQPLHPWASTSTKQTYSAASPSTLYRPLLHPAPRPQYATSMQPPTPMLSTPAPTPSLNIYAQQQHLQPMLSSAAYAGATPASVAVPLPQYSRATPVPTAIHEPQYVMPVPAPKPKAPTRADLEFLLGGPPKKRARSSTPNVALMHVSRASVAPITTGTSTAQPSFPPNARAAPVAGPSRASPTPLISSQRRAPVSRLARTAAFSGEEEPDVSADFDDSLPLGAEAVMESDHEADISDEVFVETDDPNDRDFRPTAPFIPTKQRSRLSQTSAENNPTQPDTPPRTSRRSLASSSTGTGKVPGSATKPVGEASSTTTPAKKRGRPRKEFYTSDAQDKMKVANEILAMPPDLSGPKTRLDDIIDRKTRQQLSPEMRAAILRARNTQLQRERRERIHQAELAAKREKENLAMASGADTEGNTATPAAGGGEVKRRRGRPRTRLRVEEEPLAASGSAIVERARGKVVEWIKTISSEAEQSVDEAEETADANGRIASPMSPAQPAVADPAVAVEGTAIDPALRQRSGAGEEAAVAARALEGAEAGAGAEETRNDAADLCFSRFGKVTGKEDPSASIDRAVRATVAADAAAEGSGKVLLQDGQPYEAGVTGDEYYFST